MFATREKNARKQVRGLSLVWDCAVTWQSYGKLVATFLQGPSDKEIRRDITTFEEARSTWAKTRVSHRRKVGASGDHKTEMWLG